MILVQKINGRTCPMVVCDFCSEPIREMGNVLLGKGGHLFAHKGCDPKQTDDGEFYSWMELSHFLVYLVRNSQIDWEMALRTASMLEEAGL